MQRASHEDGRSPLVRPTTAVSVLVVLAWALTFVAQVGRITLAGSVRASGVLHEPSPLVLGGAAELLIFMSLVTIGGLVVLRSEQRRYGWLLVAYGVAGSIVGTAAEYSVYALVVAPERGLPLGMMAGWTQDLWMAQQALGFFLLPLLFPDGRFPFSRWRWLFRLTAWWWGVVAVVFMAAERSLSNIFEHVGSPPANPTGFLPIPAMVVIVLWVAVVVLSVVTAGVGVVTRWRHAACEFRQQLKWVLYGFGLVLTAVAVGIADGLLENLLGVDVVATPLLDVMFGATNLALVVALGLAVLRYRLYDVDLVINRTLVYGVLTAAIVASYVLIVAGVGALLPETTDRLLSLLATAVVAVGFSPLRVRVQSIVNRLMFGARDDPYVVMSKLGRELAGSAAPARTLQTIVDTVAEALRLPWVAVELDQRDGRAIRAEHGSAAGDEASDLVVVPIIHLDDVVGRLVAAPRSPHESLSFKDCRLLEDIAYQAGAVAHAVRLTTDLQRSREQLVAAREEERRRIRRDLHDGLGPSLASQSFKLDAALDRVGSDPEGAARLLSSLKRETQQLVADIRRLVYELRPPALDELGLAGALAARVRHLDGVGNLLVEVITEPAPLPPLPAGVEVAAYGIAHEAITNAVRHARAKRCTVTLTAADAWLRVCVCDDGVGIPSERRPGIGLISMRERAEELGGTLTVDSAHPRGTQATASLPIGHSNVARPSVASESASTSVDREADPATALSTREAASHG